ncbi:MAG TPA: SDR family NAD(P)-dependent oxidoreductase [Paenalcaligenes hominis]|uniref:NAD(P)-dependent dehydrogenase (Short-subunit alcohol dehydrogenase family) n=1 Tax=Paenalcaligenes hominis TaxID=643674 RepID=A0A9D3AAL2_9BURK|nr:SDR family NAD(P)-dependent oxidoreductase [Paenalcaligenes hominis]NJB64247.1 NAD(P)-dependent dehydrogenase (short-subunit alcohol dehydrogenase family) [Paenalcaligenes hominis]GGE69080.1 short-chain dehydrogenase/reductase [Paenalcaligenes hominis]HJH23555.1 SDR family NAD(P)-dependent oxidoreductase [Paenalcaligenes hominis]
MINEVIVITGVSRGLGLALAQQLAQPQRLVIGIARSNNAQLAAHCHAHDCAYHFIQTDLALPQGCAHAAHALGELLQAHPQARSYWLINNAGTVAPMAQSHQLTDPYPIAHALQLNVGSLISLSAAFLTHAPAASDRRILNISSGAGRGPVPGWGVYGATKSAVDYFTQTLALEQPQVRTVALAPGVIDTDMQADIRQTEPESFPNRERFIQLHQNQQLASASFTAEQIARYLANDTFGTKTVDDIRHYF